MCRSCESVPTECRCNCYAPFKRLQAAARKTPKEEAIAPYATKCDECNHMVTWKIKAS